MIQRDYDPKKADRYHAYMQGWRDGAVGRSEDDRFMKHETLGGVYREGYAHGGTAVSLVAGKAARHFGYSPSILRAEGGRVVQVEAVHDEERVREIEQCRACARSEYGCRDHAGSGYSR